MGRRKTPIEWKTYNKELVNRGRKLGAHISAMRRFICEHWDAELALMNAGKEGARYRYPESPIILFLILKIALRNPAYRFLEGFGGVLLANVPSYSILQRRIARLAPEVIAGINRKITRARTKVRGLTIAIDATGIKVTNRGEWFRHKWRTSRGWIKVSVAIERKNKRLLDVQMSEEVVPDGDLAEKHLETFEKGQVKGFWMDGVGNRITREWIHQNAPHRRLRNGIPRDGAERPGIGGAAGSLGTPDASGIPLEGTSGGPRQPCLNKQAFQVAALPWRHGVRGHRDE